MELFTMIPSPKSTFKEKYKVLWQCFLILLLIKFVGSIFITISIFSHFNGLTNLLENQVKLTDSYSMGVSLLLIIIVMPAIEEFAFRGWFTNSIAMILISLTLLSYYF